MRYPSNLKLAPKPQVRPPLNPGFQGFQGPLPKPANQNFKLGQIKRIPSFGRYAPPVVVRGAGLRMGGKLISRLIPYLGWALLAYDAYELWQGFRPAIPPIIPRPYPGFDPIWSDFATHTDNKEGPMLLARRKIYYNKYTNHQNAEYQRLADISLVGVNRFSEEYWQKRIGYSWGLYATRTGWARKPGPVNNELFQPGVMQQPARLPTPRPLPYWVNPGAVPIDAWPNLRPPPYAFIPHLQPAGLPEQTTRAYGKLDIKVYAKGNTSTFTRIKSKRKQKTNPRVSQDKKFNPRSKPAKREKEKKVMPKNQAGMKAIKKTLSRLTESADLVNILWLQLHESKRTGYFKLHKRGGVEFYKKRYHPAFHQMIVDIYNGFETIDISKAISAFIDNQIADAIAGTIGRAAKNTSRRIGNTTGLTRALDIGNKATREAKRMERERRQTKQFDAWRRRQYWLGKHKTFRPSEQFRNRSDEYKPRTFGK